MALIATVHVLKAERAELASVWGKSVYIAELQQEQNILKVPNISSYDTKPIFINTYWP